MSSMYILGHIQHFRSTSVFYNNRTDFLVNWLKVRTKVSVESLCVRIFGPKTMGRRFDTISNSWLTGELSASLPERQATRCAGAGPLPSQSSLTRRTSRMAVPLKSDSRID